MKTYRELGEMHALTADVLTNGLKYMKATEEYNPALLNSAIKFLKDNHVECTSDAGSPLNELKVELLPFLNEQHRDTQRTAEL